MLHYRKGENVEQELSKTDLPFEDCMPKGESDFLWMHVKGGTKVDNVVSYAKNALDKGEYRTMVWSGSGGGVIKTISCAEILKRSYPLYQVSRMCYVNVEEHWKPQLEGLEEIIATRQIPSLHILLTLNPLDETINGLQKPNTQTEFWQDTKSNSKQTRNHQQQHQQQHQNQQKHHQQQEKQNQHDQQQQTEERSTPSNKSKSRKRQRRPKRDSDPTKPSTSSSEQPDKEADNQTTDGHGIENIQT